MTTTELIEFLATEPFTKDQAYNLIIADIYECVTEDEIATPGGSETRRVLHVQDSGSTASRP
jgi:hypothetical protein